MFYNHYVLLSNVNKARTGEAVEKGREESGGNRLAGLQELSHRVTSARRASKEGEQGWSVHTFIPTFDFHAPECLV